MGGKRKHIDINGRYGRLTVLSLYQHVVGSMDKYLCKCDCGKEKIVRKDYLYTSPNPSCGCYTTELSIKHNRNNIEGKRFGSLVVKSIYHKRGNRLYWEAVCDCGNMIVKRADSFKSNSSCGCQSLGRLKHYLYKQMSLRGELWVLDRYNNIHTDKSLIGKRFNRLTLIKYTNLRDKNGNVKCKFKCECGVIVTLPFSVVVKGYTKSCGCLKIDRIREQGLDNKGANNGMFGKRRELNPNWKGEAHRTEYDRIRKSDEYIKWRDSVKSRDEYRCQPHVVDFTGKGGIVAI